MRAVRRVQQQMPVAAGGAGAAEVSAPSGLGGYYSRAPYIALVLIAIMAARLHEVIPFMDSLRPALSVGVLGSLLIFARSQPLTLHQAVANPLLRLLVVLTGWALVTAPWALWPTLALSSAISILVPIVLMTFVILTCEPNERNLYLLKLGLMGAAAAHGFLLLVGRSGSSFGRLESVASLDANDLALLMVMAFPFAVSEALHSKGRRRWLAIFGAIVFLTVVVKTGSRGGTLALMTAGLVYVVAARGIRRGLALGVLVVAGVLTWLLAPASFRARMATVTELETDYNTTAYDGRKQIWKRARGYIRQHPIAGVGMSNFSVAEGNELTNQNLKGKWSVTHNSYLQVTSELGAVGALIFLAIFGLATLRALALRQSHWSGSHLRGGQPEFLSALAGFAAGGYFLSHAYFYAFYALVAVTVFAHRVQAAGYQVPVTGVIPATRSRGERGFRSLRTAHLRSR